MSTDTLEHHLVQPYKSLANKVSEEYKRNYEEWQPVVAELQERLQEATAEGKEKHIKLHKKRGQLLARERINLLLDEDSPFLELCQLAGYGQEDMTLGGSVVGGIGLVCGIECMVVASVPTLAGGSMNEASVLKGSRIAQIVHENGLPVINLTQSGGANLEQQFKVFHRGGGGFRNQAILSKSGIPSCCVVFGSSTAGGAYTPGMTDCVIMVKKQAQVFLGGPPLVQMATGEVTDAESLGGADMHSRISGVKILGVASANIRVPYDAMEVIARIVDGSRFAVFKPLYGVNLITGWAFIHGIPVGIIANNNVLFTAESNKATQFIQLCNLKNTPIVFLQNITGFMVGKRYEEDGIIKAGARFINAVSNSTVPAITIMMGASYGAGNYAMCGRSYNPRFLFSWPNSKCSVMGPEQLTGVLDIVMRQAAKRAGIEIDEEVAATRKEMFQSLVESESDVYYTSARMLDDGIIDPRDTRTVLGFCLSVVYNKEVKGGNLYGVSRM
ncbi:ClpP/crotonase-like domain-containing protein [Umbelopsis sp. PMI_123]|nr:ClpP/crotonase-like domain-containing protein [Umbelopsis sp. PMI_123]